MNFLKKINYKLIVVLLTPLILLLQFESSFLLFYKTIILSLIIIYAFYFLLVAIFNNTKWATLLAATFIYIIYVISKLKLYFMNEPIYFADFLYLNNTGEIFSIVDDSFSDAIISQIINFIYVLAIYILLVIINFKCNIKFKSHNNKMLVLSTSYIILLIMFLPIKPVNKYIINNFYKVNDRKDYLAITSGRMYCYNFGHLAGIYGDYLESRVYKPDNYNTKKIEDALKNSKTETDKTLGTPNIIVVFSESFWDIDQLEEIEFDKPITSNYNKLKDEGLFFEMISPSYGGISANVEFEFLTGGSLNYFGRSFVPYMNLYKNKKYYNTPNIITELKNAGYYTKIVPFTSSSLFNCGKAYKYFKIDETEFIPKVKDKYKKGVNVSDKYVTDKIINEFKNKKSNTPLFYMTLTMQSHMPYRYDKYDKYDIKIVNSNLDDNYNEELLSYAQGIYDADKELARLYEFIKTYDEPTIIIFYGDHLPFINAFEKLNYFNTNDDKLNVFRKYNTESLILANFDISNLQEENKNKLHYLGPDLLSAYILNHMDINISNYYKWLYNTKSIIGASNRFVSVDQNGNIYYTEKLTGKMKKINDFREMVQYKFFIK